MRKVLLVGALAAFGALSAQQKNSVKANPFALLGGTDLVNYERAIGEHSSVGGGLGLGGFKFGGAKYSSFGANLAYRYFFEEALRGWYGLGIVFYQGGSVKLETPNFFGGPVQEAKSDFNAFGLGARGGYQWIWDSGFTLDLSLGFTYSSFSYSGDTNSQTLDLKGGGVLPSFGVALGYSF